MQQIFIFSVVAIMYFYFFESVFLRKIIYLSAVVLFISIFFVFDCFAQISVKGIPHSFQLSLKSIKTIPETVTDSVNISNLISEDEQKGIPNRFALAEELSINIKEKGVQTVLSDGGTIWQYKIQSPGAKSLGLIFSTYMLPEGADLFIYNPDKTRIAGAFTSQNNKNEQMPVAQFKGDNLIIEYYEPADLQFEGQLVLGSVLKAYRELYLAESAATVQIGINCAEGQDWQDQKRSVCLMSFREGAYGYYCTGFLVNNIRQDGTPYFMTANHCISTNSVASTLVSYFNYENSTCSSDDASREQSLSGAVLRATAQRSDFTLLELSEYPSEEYRAFYAGWDASGDQPSSGVCIHHPQGGTKSIALGGVPTSFSSTIQWEDKTVSPRNTHWEVSFVKGGTESGSSGSPLFDNNARVIGQLHGGDDESDFYGKFSVSWNYNSVYSGQLYHWLDPDQTGTLTLDGIDYGQPPVADFSVERTLSCVNTTVAFTDNSTKSATAWLWIVEPATAGFVNNTNNTSQNPEISFTEAGIYTITLVASNEFGSDTIRSEDLITVVDNLSVMFSNASEEITICGYELDNYELVSEGAYTYEFDVEESDRFDISSEENILSLTLTDEYKKQGSFDTYVKVIGSAGDCYDSDSILFHVIIPDNDYIENAVRLKLGNNPSYSNLCGTLEDEEPCSSSGECSNSIWFNFVGTSNGNISIEANGFDNHISVYAADSYSDIISGDEGAYELLGSSRGSSSYIENLVVEPGKVYWLQLDGNSGETGEASISLHSNTLEAWPNPASDECKLTVSALDNSEAIIEVYNMQGRKFFSKTVTTTADSNTFTLDLSAYPASMYLIRVMVDGLVMNKKLIVIK